MWNATSMGVSIPAKISCRLWFGQGDLLRRSHSPLSADVGSCDEPSADVTLPSAQAFCDLFQACKPLQCNHAWSALKGFAGLRQVASELLLEFLSWLACVDWKHTSGWHDDAEPSTVKALESCFHAALKRLLQQPSVHIYMCVSSLPAGTMHNLVFVVITCSVST